MAKVNTQAERLAEEIVSSLAGVFWFSVEEPQDIWAEWVEKCVIAGKRTRKLQYQAKMRKQPLKLVA